MLLKLNSTEDVALFINSTNTSFEITGCESAMKQTDGVAMGSPLGPALANIFVGYYEEMLFSEIRKPSIYFRYADHTFSCFNHEAEADKFLTKLNCLHPSLKVTFENEKDKYPQFLDIFVEKTRIGFETICKPKTYFHWPVFTVRWESFSPLKRKIRLISTLVH